jgi:ABC-type polysaccharide/polyol phosphate transport system ATPase subunit
MGTSVVTELIVHSQYKIKEKAQTEMHDYLAPNTIVKISSRYRNVEQHCDRIATLFLNGSVTEARPKSPKITLDKEVLLW